jgi:hypothetical protein
MRILIIASERPPVASGVAHSVDRLARGLRQHGHEVDTLSSADAPYLVSGEVRLSGLGGGCYASRTRSLCVTTSSTFMGQSRRSPTSR